MTQATAQRFERPLAGRKVSGVCAAVARHQRVDVTLVRGATLLLMAAGGIGFVAYFVGLLLIPGEGASEPLVREGVDGPERTKVIVLGLVAVIALFGLGEGPFGFFGIFDGPAWPFLAIVAIAAAAVAVTRRDSSPAPFAPVGAPPVTTPAPGASEATTAIHPAAQVMPGPPSREERHWTRSLLILGGTLLALAAAGAILGASGTGVRWDVALCAGAIGIGAILVITAPFGGARILAPIGVLLVLLAGTAAAADLDLRGGVGDHLVRPTSLTATGNSYHLAAGRLMVDLRDVKLTPGQLTTVHAEVGFGQLVVRVPRGVVVQASAHASAGDIELFGRDENGLDAKRSQIVNGHGSRSTLVIDAHTGFGQVRVVSSSVPLPKLGDHASISTGDTR